MTSEDIEKRNAKQAEYRAKNPEKVKALARIKSAAYRARNPEKVKAYDAEYRAKNPEKYATLNAVWIANNRDRKNANNAAWQRAHPEQGHERNARRRALKLNAPVNDLTAIQWDAIKKHYGSKCVYCGKKPKRLTMDHIQPLSKGGSHTLANIVPACKSCNSRKGNRSVLSPVQPLLLL